MPKILHLVALINLISVPLAALSQGVIEIKNFKQTGLVAQALPVEIRITVDANPNYEGYWTQAWHEPVKCESSRWPAALSSRSSKLAETVPSKLMPLPLRSDTQFEVSLPAGHWQCHVQISVPLQNRNGQKEERLMTSKEFVIEVEEPTEEDIKLLQAMGLWEDYGKGENRAGSLPSTLDLPKLGDFPNSSYYCELWVEIGFKRQIAQSNSNFIIENGMKFISEPHSGPLIKMIGDNDPMPNQYLLYVNAIDNLLNSPCQKASKEELWYWKSISYLLGGRFNAAKLAARKGRRIAVDSRYVKWFKKMDSFRCEQDFMKFAAATDVK